METRETIVSQKKGADSPESRDDRRADFAGRADRKSVGDVPDRGP